MPRVRRNHQQVEVMILIMWQHHNHQPRQHHCLQIRTNGSQRRYMAIKKILAKRRLLGFFVTRRHGKQIANRIPMTCGWKVATLLRTASRPLRIVISRTNPCSYWRPVPTKHDMFDGFHRPRKHNNNNRALGMVPTRGT